MRAFSSLVGQALLASVAILPSVHAFTSSTTIDRLLYIYFNENAPQPVVGLHKGWTLEYHVSSKDGKNFLPIGDLNPLPTTKTEGFGWHSTPGNFSNANDNGVDGQLSGTFRYRWDNGWHVEIDLVWKEHFSSQVAPNTQIVSNNVHLFGPDGNPANITVEMWSGRWGLPQA